MGSSSDYRASLTQLRFRALLARSVPTWLVVTPWSTHRRSTIPSVGYVELHSESVSRYRVADPEEVHVAVGYARTPAVARHDLTQPAARRRDPGGAR